MTRVSKDLSIIVPCYNGDKFIKKTIDDLEKISGIDYELIVINDGSTDNSNAIISNLKKKNKNIVYINNKKNKGVSSSRNIGINEASGEYIAFVDCDDIVDPKMYVELLQNARKNNLDISMCDYYEVFDDLKVNSKYNYLNEIIGNDEVIKRYLLDTISNNIWDKIFKHKLLANVIFNEDLRIGEDILFCLETFIKTKRMGFINKEYYGYVQNVNSAMHNIKNKFTGYKEIFKYLNYDNTKFLSENYPAEFEYFRLEMIIRGIHAISMNSNKNNRKDCINMLKSYYSRKDLNNIIKNRHVGRSIKIEMLLLKVLGANAHIRMMPLYRMIRNRIR